MTLFISMMLKKISVLLDKDDGLKLTITLSLVLCTLAFSPGCSSIKGFQNLEKVDQILQVGNRAMLAGQYDEAIRQFDSGLAISPNETAFLTSKSSALRLRGVERYNKSISLGDEKAKALLKDQAKHDLQDSATLATEVIKLAASQPLEMIEAKLDGGNNVARLANRAEALRLVASIVDKTQADEALAAARAYLAAEPDPNKKQKARLSVGQLLIDTGQADQAVAEYKTILENDPDNVDALLGVGLFLSQSGDLVKYREAEPYLQRFVELAHDNHPMKKSIQDTLSIMKEDGSQPSSSK